MDGGRAPRGNFAPVPLTGRRPPVERWLAIIAVALILAVAKPWASPVGSGGPSGAPAGPAIRSGQGAATAAPSPSSPSDGARRLVAAFCLDTRSWLVASIGRSRGQRIRVWQTIEPATAASGPNDPAIPIVPVVSEGLTELGWCAPVSGDEKPGGGVDVTVWLRSATGARRIVVDTSRPVPNGSPFGELYLPPGRSPTSGASSWPSGTFVFRWREDDGRERWFAVEVEIRPSPGAGAH